MIFEDNFKYSLLFEIYKDLLTAKQQKFLKDYLDNNLSISELALLYSSTRQAMNDLLKRTFKVLDNYESKLKLLKKFNYIKGEIAEIQSKTENEKLKQKLNNILEVL